MWAIVTKLLNWVAVGGIPAFMIHAGFSVAIFTGMEFMVNEALNYAVSQLNNIASVALQLALLSGVGTFFNIVGSALLTRMAISAAMQSIGIMKT